MPRWTGWKRKKQSYSQSRHWRVKSLTTKHVTFLSKIQPALLVVMLSNSITGTNFLSTQPTLCKFFDTPISRLFHTSLVRYHFTFSLMLCFWPSSFLFSLYLSREDNEERRKVGGAREYTTSGWKYCTLNKISPPLMLLKLFQVVLFSFLLTLRNRKIDNQNILCQTLIDFFVNEEMVCMVDMCTF